MDHFQQSIAALQKTLAEHEQKVVDTKRLINALAEAAGQDPIYSVEHSGEESLAAIKSDSFYGQPLARCVRQILDMRKASGLSAASVREIFDALKQGGFEFPRAKSDKIAMDSMRISLGKMSHTFHKLPNGNYGLIEWYPAVKQAKSNRPKNKTDEGDGDSSASNDDGDKNDD